MFKRLRYFLETRSSRGGPPVPAPSERAWTHPSELPASFEKAVLPPPRARVHRGFQVAVASVSGALLATGALLLSGPTSGELAGAANGPHVATSVGALPASVRVAASATVALVIYEHAHLGAATGMVVPPGNLVVTTTPIPDGASVMALQPGRKLMALTIVGSDRALGVTVLRLPTTVHVTPVGPLEPAVSTGGAPTALTALTALRGTTTKVQFQYAAAYLNARAASTRLGTSTISVTHGTSLVGVVPGALVLDAHGRAVAASVPALGGSSYVPASFLVELAQRLVLGDRSGHGWLQVSGPSYARGPAKVTSVTIGGPAFRHVEPGDVITAIDAHKVHTMADVGSVLYASSPGRPVQITLLRDGTVVVVSVTLAAQP